MILDEVLHEENRSFDKDDMVDIFAEGFLFALEMQEAGYKAGSTEELSEKLIEGADIAISELSDKLINHAINKSEALSKRHERLTFMRGRHYKSMKNDKNTSDGELLRARHQAELQDELSQKYGNQTRRLKDKLKRRNKKGYNGIY